MDTLRLAAEKRSISLCRRCTQPAMLLPEGRADGHILVCVLQGEWEVSLQEQRYVLHPKEYLLLPAGTCLQGMAAALKTGEILCTSFAACAGDAVITSEEAALPAEGVLQLSVLGSMPAKAMPLLRHMAEAWHAGARQAEKVLVQVLAEAAKALKAPSMDQQAIMRSICQLMEQNSDRFFTAEELADMVGISPRTLLKYFHNQLGMPVRQYQLHQKLEKAHALLEASPDAPLSLVAEQLGFCDEFHFSKQYNKHFGYSPKRMK